MPDLNPIIAAAPAASAKPAQGNARDAANPADAGNGQQAFANVLRDKTTAADPAQNAAKAPADTDKSKDADKAKAKDKKEDDDTAQTQAGQPSQSVSADAILAACMPQAPRPDAVLAAGATATDTTGKSAKDTLASLADEGAGTDPRRPLTAAVADPIAAKASAAAAAGSKDATAGTDTDFSALLGHLRQEGRDKEAGQAQTADASTSTLAMLMPANHMTETQPAAAQRPSTLIEAPVGSPLFADETAQRITWLAKNGIEHAEIRVTPPDMGPIQVSIDMKQNEATINFTVHQTDTRVALEDSLHRLEEMLADSGISLAQANVGQRDAGQSQSGGQSGGRSSGGGRNTGLGGIDATGSLAAGASRPAAVARGLVDTFA
ncbi:MAG TPA: flagellar hook-length control protein FliK [Burkholderiales bacterium]|jgi:flagellar hook-length control protein FliK|nr:flagellar hook-length control protein FliK [Burkholderiales bacterium]